MAETISTVAIQPNPETQVPGVGITPAGIRPSPISAFTERVTPVLAAHQRIKRTTAEVDNSAQVAVVFEALSAQAQTLKEQAKADPENFGAYITQADRLQSTAMNTLRKLTPLEKWGSLNTQVKDAVELEFGFKAEIAGQSSIFSDNEGNIIVNPIQKQQGVALVAAKYEQDLIDSDPLVALWYSKLPPKDQDLFKSALVDSAKTTYENTVKYNLGNSEDQLEALDLHELQRSAPGRQVGVAKAVEQAAMPLITQLEEKVRLGELAGPDVIRAAVHEAFALPTRSMTDSWKSPKQWEAHGWKSSLDAQKFVQDVVAEQYVNRLVSLDILHKAKVDSEFAEAQVKTITAVQKYNEAVVFGNINTHERLNLRDPNIMTNLSMAIDLYENRAFQNQVSGILPTAVDTLVKSVSLTLASQNTVTEADRYAFAGPNAEQMEPFANTANYINAAVKIVQSGGTLKAPEGFKYLVGQPLVQLYKKVMEDPRYEEWAKTDPQTAASLNGLNSFMRRYEKTADLRSQSMEQPAVRSMLNSGEATLDGMKSKYGNR